MRSSHFCFFLLLILSPLSYGQTTSELPPKTAPTSTAITPDEVATEPEQAVAITPQAEDRDIATRITEILTATGWYQNPTVSVTDGVVFLDGIAGTEDQRLWARNLAAKTQDVVAVVNRIKIDNTPDLSFRLAYRELKRLAFRFINAIPLILLSFIVIPIAWIIAKLVYRGSNHFFSKRIGAPLLADILAKAVALPTMLIGLYIVLQVAGLTSIALSLLGGAGVVGIVLGFAFRDIAENFLASLLLSIRQPFSAGDLIDVAGKLGIVQNMNTRTTVLLSPEGNHIQIPNATVFKSIINNYSAAPARRNILDIGIGYDAPISHAQNLIMDVLMAHEAVTDDPQPLVLVDKLGAATVNLKVYYWFDGARFSQLKVQSALLRQIKQILLENNISMPDDAREIIFPQGVPVINQPPSAITKPATSPNHHKTDNDSVTAAEGNLANEKEELEAQVRVLPSEQKDNLLNPEEKG